MSEAARVGSGKGGGPILEVHRLAKAFGHGRGRVAAVEDVSFAVHAGETVALAGASGSGKTTVARMILRLIEPDRGAVRFGGVDLLALHGGALRAVRPRLQMVFQDPSAALNPRATVARLIDDPLRLAGRGSPAERRERVKHLVGAVGLPPDAIERRPHELSGGQRQRVAIARALATGPDLIVLDEPVSALDVSIRSQILNLLADLKETTGVAYLLVSHDLAVVRAVADRVLVMEAGRIVEAGEPAHVFAAPAAPATRALIAAVPRLGR
jgi:peptide/nickel transport system ATP-binding protein